MRSEKAILFITFVTLALFSSGQSLNAKQVYLELIGAGGGPSLNYDARFGNKENGLGYRVGIGGEFSYSSSLGTSSALAIPAGINYLLGKRKHYLDLGSGATVFFGDETYYPKNRWGLNFSAGYRLTPFEKKGVSFRAGYMHWIVFLPEADFSPYLYLGVGYRF